MEIHAEHYPEKSIIFIDTKKLMGINNQTFQNLVRNSIDKGSKNIIVDLSPVEFISSWGIGGLVHAYVTCINRHVKFNIQGVSANVMRVLYQVKLDTIINII